MGRDQAAHSAAAANFELRLRSFNELIARIHDTVHPLESDTGGNLGRGEIQLEGDVAGDPTSLPAGQRNRQHLREEATGIPRTKVNGVRDVIEQLRSYRQADFRSTAYLGGDTEGSIHIAEVIASRGGVRADVIRLYLSFAKSLACPE